MATSTRPSLGYPVDVGGAITIRRQPDELAYPLRRSEFEELQELEVLTEDKRWRDVALTSALGSLASLIGSLVTVDWAKVWVGRQWPPILFITLLGVVMLSSGLVFFVQHHRIKLAQDSSARSRLSARIKVFFDENKVGRGATSREHPPKKPCGR